MAHARMYEPVSNKHVIDGGVLRPAGVQLHPKWRDVLGLVHLKLINQSINVAIPDKAFVQVGCCTYEVFKALIPGQIGGNLSLPR